MRLTSLASICFLLLVAFVWSASVRGAEGEGDDAIIVLAGGVGDDGVPHQTVMRRLQRAASLYTQQLNELGHTPQIVCNGGGTTHKPKWVDASGYAVPEAALMGRQLVQMGVKESDIFVEGYSDDTLGNAFFARTMHVDLKPEWRRLRVITSEFQMDRTRAIYDWVFGLLPLPAHKRQYALTYDAVDDEGALPRQQLRSRRKRENGSLKAFLSGDLRRSTQLAEVHQFIFQQHSGYTVSGYLSKRPLDRSSALAQTY